MVEREWFCWRHSCPIVGWCAKTLIMDWECDGMLWITDHDPSVLASYLLLRTGSQLTRMRFPRKDLEKIVFFLRGGRAQKKR
jgi:hypothetical protein